MTDRRLFEAAVKLMGVFFIAYGIVSFVRGVGILSLDQDDAFSGWSVLTSYSANMLIVGILMIALASRIARSLIAESEVLTIGESWQITTLVQMIGVWLVATSIGDVLDWVLSNAVQAWLIREEQFAFGSWRWYGPIASLSIGAFLVACPTL